MVIPLKGATIVAKYRTRLKELREKKSFSRMDIVRLGDMAYPTVVRWETAALSSLDAAKVKHLTELLGCTYDELIYIIEESG